MEYGLGAQDNSSLKYSGDPELRKVMVGELCSCMFVCLFVCLSICYVLCCCLASFCISNKLFLRHCIDTGTNFVLRQ